ncbi:ATP:cob(I)alamin adenosyltransferase [Candidatus Woesearchaeota archaeon CG_4_10_14_0_2_um_filter_33_13]|nr:MAG: ATP:cob(I)alamin adenosyltransferase [Candidatus Woesearchaeota archaeon CG_4_10_14_0_2_um_filter_33_13]
MGKIYTKTGDGGFTHLSDMSRVVKYHPRIETIGTIDETNSAIGLARSLIKKEQLRRVDEILFRIQHELFVVGSDLAAPNPETKVPRVNDEHVTALERDIDTFTDKMPPLTSFILPGGSTASSYLHNARVLCRRAERRVVELKSVEIVNDEAISYLNRLSDLLFTLAIFVNQVISEDDVTWSKERVTSHGKSLQEIESEQKKLFR